MENDTEVDGVDELFSQKGDYGLASSALKPVYNEREYWDERYRRDETERPFFEWYDGFTAIVKALSPHLRKACSILELGSGSSELAEDLQQRFRAEDYKITCIDFSSVCISQQQKRLKEKNLDANIRCLSLDARQLIPTLSKASFDLVIDKATTDAIYAAGTEENLRDLRAVAQQVGEVLKEGGKWLVFTRKIPVSAFSATSFSSVTTTEIQDTTGHSLLFHIFIR